MNSIQIGQRDKRNIVQYFSEILSSEFPPLNKNVS